MSSPTHDSTATPNLNQTLQTRLDSGWWALPEDVFYLIINCQSPPVSGVTLKNLRQCCKGMAELVNPLFFKMVSLSPARENLEAWQALTDPAHSNLGRYVEHIYIDAAIFVLHPTIERYCTLLARHLNNLSGGKDIPRYSEQSLSRALHAKRGFSNFNSTEKELLKEGYQCHCYLAGQQTTVNQWGLGRAVNLPGLKGLSLLTGWTADPATATACFGRDTLVADATTTEVLKGSLFDFPGPVARSYPALALPPLFDLSYLTAGDGGLYTNMWRILTEGRLARCNLKYLLLPNVAKSVARQGPNPSPKQLLHNTRTADFLPGSSLYFMPENHSSGLISMLQPLERLELVMKDDDHRYHSSNPNWRLPLFLRTAARVEDLTLGFVDYDSHRIPEFSMRPPYMSLGEAFGIEEMSTWNDFNQNVPIPEAPAGYFVYRSVRPWVMNIPAIKNHDLFLPPELPATAKAGVMRNEID